MHKKIVYYLQISVLVLISVSCSNTPMTNTIDLLKTKEERRMDNAGKLGGGDGLLNKWLRGNKNFNNSDQEIIGVNTYLWQASLDTLSFMPLISADSFGGVIITDWYRINPKKDIRYKLNVYILGHELRANTLKVTSFKQFYQNNEWIDAEHKEILDRKIEDSILTRARQMRIDNTAMLIK